MMCVQSVWMSMKKEISCAFYLVHMVNILHCFHIILMLVSYCTMGTTTFMTVSLAELLNMLNSHFVEVACN